MRIILFTTNSCPYCAPAKELLAKSGIPNIEFINASEDMTLAREFKIRSVPALVSVDNEVNRTYVGVDEIQKFIETFKKA